MFKPVFAALGAALLLISCGGGGGGGSSSGGPAAPGAGGTPVNTGPDLAEIRTLTGAATSAETAADQEARAAGILARSDSLVASTMYGDTASRDVPTFTAAASCIGGTCTFTESSTGATVSAGLEDVDSSTDNAQAIGTKHGVTLLRLAGREDGVDFRTLGAWLDHSGFGVEAIRFTYEGVRVDARYSLAGGDLAGARPLGSATWQGLMVGMPATGTGRGDRLQGDASLTYSMDTQMLSAAFTNIQNIDRLRAHSVASVRFTGVPVGARGEFQAGVAGNRIQGAFYGSGHAETAGAFEQSNIVGAFGAKRQ